MKHLPNFLTCCNLMCGTLGIIYIFDQYLWGGDATLSLHPGIPPAYYVWAACVFDFFDGFAARALKVSSPIGKELDSLADVISFGLLPALFMFKYIGNSAPGTGYLPYVALLIAVFSALRLAIFNVDEKQKDSFRGLPTPANALFLTGFPFLPFHSPAADFFLYSPWVLATVCIVFSLLLVAPIELFALKFKSFRWEDNKIRFTFLAISVLLIVFFQVAAIPLIILLYIVLSLVSKVFSV